MRISVIYIYVFRWLQDCNNSIANALELLQVSLAIDLFRKLYMLQARPRIHYDDIIMGAMASQITSLTIVYSTVYSGADQRKHQSSASLAFVGEFTGDWWTASNAENVSIWWRHHGCWNNYS